MKIIQYTKDNDHVAEYSPCLTNSNCLDKIEIENNILSFFVHREYYIKEDYDCKDDSLIGKKRKLPTGKKIEIDLNEFNIEMKPW